MEEQHGLTKKDKFIQTAVQIIIFVGILGMGHRATERPSLI